VVVSGGDLGLLDADAAGRLVGEQRHELGDEVAEQRGLGPGAAQEAHLVGDERVVDVHIKTMRAALGDDASAPRIVGTVRGVGYKFLKDPA